MYIKKKKFYTTKDVGDGVGLGMSISHGIIEKHNGSIEVKIKDYISYSIYSMFFCLIQGYYNYEINQ
jgi:K+-sensing histidine kinase KdpD